MIPSNYSASEASKKIVEGWITSVDLVQSCLDRIAETDGALHAWAYVDVEGALARAAQMDNIRRSGYPTGRLHGIPVGLKDIIDTKDMPTQRGTTIFKGRQPDADAFIVQRLLGEGAIILGKTVTTELAFVHANETHNPHNVAHSPGGSSSGSAAAVAAYQVPLAVGT
jgi:Asp-tRNA(Asn)/Glu-tRNA(Gln) amidotransferase A subunit family amidase